MPQDRVVQSGDRLESGTRRSREAWVHFAWVVFLGTTAQLVVALAWLLQDGHSLVPSVVATIPAWGGWIYASIPIATGVSVVLVRPLCRDTLKRLVFVATLLMVVADGVAPTGPVQMGQRLATRGVDVFSDPSFSRFSRLSVVRTSVDLLLEPSGQVSERLERYPPHHPRLRASHVLTKGSFIGLPAVLAAIIGGLLIWIDGQVTFKRAGARKVSQMWLAWAVAPGLCWLWAELTEQARTSAIFGAGTLPMTLLPMILFGTIAWVVWRTIPLKST